MAEDWPARFADAGDGRATLCVSGARDRGVGSAPETTAVPNRSDRAGSAALVGPVLEAGAVGAVEPEAVPERRT